MKVLKSCALGLGVAVVFLTGEARANLVTNGGFETTVPASNVSGLNPAGWTVTSPGGDTFDNCGSVPGAP
jgi:hypothetical protein